MVDDTWLCGKGKIESMGEGEEKKRKGEKKKKCRLICFDRDFFFFFGASEICMNKPKDEHGLG